MAEESHDDANCANDSSDSGRPVTPPTSFVSRNTAGAPPPTVPILRRIIGQLLDVPTVGVHEVDVLCTVAVSGCLRGIDASSGWE